MNGASCNQKLMKKAEMKKFQCFCCQKFGHYARDCYFNKESKDNDEGLAQFSHARSSDSEEAILMADT